MAGRPWREYVGRRYGRFEVVAELEARRSGTRDHLTRRVLVECRCGERYERWASNLSAMALRGGCTRCARPPRSRAAFSHPPHARTRRCEAITQARLTLGLLQREVAARASIPEDYAGWLEQRNYSHKALGRFTLARVLEIARAVAGVLRLPVEDVVDLGAFDPPLGLEEPPAELARGPTEGPLGALIAREELAGLRGCLARLTRDQQGAVLATTLGAEARRRGVTKEAVRVLRDRALRRLRCLVLSCPGLDVDRETVARGLAGLATQSRGRGSS